MTPEALKTGRAIYLDEPNLTRFLDQIRVERAAQIAKWGDQRHPDGTHPDLVWAFTGPAAYVAQCARSECQRLFEEGYGTWRDILREEVAEAFEQDDPATLRAELVQIAAVCAAWVSDIDRRETSPAPAVVGTQFAGGVA